MTRAKSRRFLPLLLLVFVAFWAAHATDSSSGAPVTANGAYMLTFNVKTPSTVPNGATVKCTAKVTPRLSVIESLTRRAIPVESTQGVATVNGSSAACAVAVPFAFAVKDPINGADLAYEIDASTAAAPLFVRTQQGIGIPYPRTGTIKKLRINVAL